MATDLRRLAIVLLLVGPGCKKEPVQAEVSPAAAIDYTGGGAPPGEGVPPPEAFAPEPTAAPRRERVKLEPSDGGTANGHPEGPRAEAVNALIESSGPKLRGCLDKIAGLEAQAIEVKLAYTLRRDGKMSEVSASGNAPTAAVPCLQEAFSSLSSPPFGGAPLKGVFSFSYRRK